MHAKTYDEKCEQLKVSHKMLRQLYNDMEQLHDTAGAQIYAEMCMGMYEKLCECEIQRKEAFMLLEVCTTELLDAEEYASKCAIKYIEANACAHALSFNLTNNMVNALEDLKI